MHLLSLGPRDGYPDTRELSEKGPARRVSHVVDGVAPRAVFVVETLDLGHGNVAEEWYRMGSPTNLTPTQTEHLRAVADGMERYTLTASSDGVLEIDVELAPWAVMSIVQA